MPADLTTARFVAFRSHWRFEAEFCTPAEPHEKGGIEGEAGYFRRNHWVPVPEAADIADINRQFLNACQQNEHHLIAGREQTVRAGMVIEREHLLPLATEGEAVPEGWWYAAALSEDGAVAILHADPTTAQAARR